MTGLIPDYVPPETSMLPVSWAVAGYGIPNVCPRHGLPPVRLVKAKFESRPPLWTYLFLLAGGLPYLIVAVAVTKNIKVRQWPECGKCVSLRHRRILGGWALILSMFPLCVA